MMPDLNSLTVYGVPWMLVGAVVVWLLKKRFASEVALVFTAIWAALGYFLVTNLQAIESLWPAMPDVLPQLLTVILIIGSVLGFQPGEIAEKVRRKVFMWRLMRKERQGK